MRHIMLDMTLVPGLKVQSSGAAFELCGKARKPATASATDATRKICAFAAPATRGQLALPVGGMPDRSTAQANGRCSRPQLNMRFHRVLRKILMAPPP